MAMVTQASRSVSGVPAFQRAVCVPTCAVNTASAPLSWNCASDSPHAFSPDWKSPEILKLGPLQAKAGLARNSAAKAIKWERRMRILGAGDSGLIEYAAENGEEWP